jgi:hypothetical protein
LTVKNTSNHWFKTAAVVIGLFVVFFVLPMVIDFLGLKKPLELTQGHYLGALIAFFVLLWKVDQQSAKIQELLATIKDVEEVAKYIASSISE